MVSVFVQSNHFREDLEQYDNSTFHTFLTPTATTPEIVETAIECLKRIYRHDIYYKRAGVMVTDISPAKTIQPDLFSYDPERRKKLDCVSQTLDNINSRMGADTVVLGAQQYCVKDSTGKNLKFVNAIRRALKSPDYTTRLGAFVIN